MLPASDRDRLVQIFLHADRDLAEQARIARCPDCGGALHAGLYRRKLCGLESWPEAAAEGSGFRVATAGAAWGASVGDEPCRRR